MNGNVEATAHDRIARVARVAWFCAFVLPLLLSALLLGVSSAQATTPESEPAPLAFEEEFEPEEEGEGEGERAEEECENAQEEFEEGELSKAEAGEICKEAREAAKEAAAASGADECPIHSATAHSSIHNTRLKLTIGYTTISPVTATIELRGPIKDSFKRHLSKSGVLRFTESSPKQHGRLVVQIKLPSPTALTTRPSCSDSPG